MDNLIKVLTEFEGIIGTIIGVLVGSVTSYFQNNSGKIKAFFTEAHYSYQLVEDDGIGGEKVIILEDEEKATTFNFYSSIELYNSSNTKKNLRDIKLFIEMKKNKEYLKLQLDDGLATSFDILNIEAKTIVEYTIYAGANNSEERKKIFENKLKNLYIEYKDTNGRRHKFKIRPLTRK